MFNEDILLGSQQITYLSDLALAPEEHRAETQLLKFLEVSNSDFILEKQHS